MIVVYRLWSAFTRYYMLQDFLYSPVEKRYAAFFTTCMNEVCTAKYSNQIATVSYMCFLDECDAFYQRPHILPTLHRAHVPSFAPQMDILCGEHLVARPKLLKSERSASGGASGGYAICSTPLLRLAAVPPTLIRPACGCTPSPGKPNGVAGRPAGASPCPRTWVPTAT
jgi:hypothetical protein